MAWPPCSPQRIPDLFKRCVARVLHAASVTPEPIGRTLFLEHGVAHDDADCAENTSVLGQSFFGADTCREGARENGSLSPPPCRLQQARVAVSRTGLCASERRGARQPVDDLEEFERELHSLFATAEAEVVGHEVLNRYGIDIDLPLSVTVDGIVHGQRVSLAPARGYLSSVRSGPVQVMRSCSPIRLARTSERLLFDLSSDGVCTQRDWWKGVGHRLRSKASRKRPWVVSSQCHLTPGEGDGTVYGTVVR